MTAIRPGVEFQVRIHIEQEELSRWLLTGVISVALVGICGVGAIWGMALTVWWWL